MYSISLHNIKLYGYHGVHQEETVVGGNFELTITVHFQPYQPIKELGDTINYVSIYDVVKYIFATPQQLLETLAQDMVYAIYSLDNRIKSINISIQKLNPPIHNFTGTVGFQLYKEF